VEAKYRSLTTERPVAEGRFDDGAHVMRSIGQHQKSLSDRRHGRSGVEDPAPEIDAQGRVARLEGEVRVAQFRDASGLGALAARVDTFEDDEGTTTHHSSVCVAAIKAALDFSPWATAARLAVPVAFFAGDFLVAFFAGFFVAFLTACGDDSTVRRCAVRRVTRRRDRGRWSRGCRRDEASR